MQDYHLLDIWNRAMDDAVAVYQFVATLPEQEKDNLASQLRRAVTSAAEYRRGMWHSQQVGV